ncbi:MAG: hypothetical protein L6Q81_05835 [Bacteroidia bacterium]|nr:hypothetical protein [Bacteroidia bacterium]
MTDKKLSLHIADKNTTALSSGFTDRGSGGLQTLTVGGPGYGGSGGSIAYTRPPANSLASKDVTLNDSITRDASGQQSGNNDPDTYLLA